jgi:NAD(P)H-dependent FMN reductase
VRILLISGSTRVASTNSAALRTLAALAPDGVDAVMYEEIAVLPAFNPDDAPDAHASVSRLRAQLSGADAVLFCTPEYAGTLPGSLKNLLDWIVGTGELYGKPVAWLTVAQPGRGEGAQATLATVLGYVGAVVIEAACVRLPVGRDAVAPDGLVADPAFRAGLADLIKTITGYPD